MSDDYSSQDGAPEGTRRGSFRYQPNYQSTDDAYGGIEPDYQSPYHHANIAGDSNESLGGPDDDRGPSATSLLNKDPSRDSSVGKGARSGRFRGILHNRKKACCLICCGVTIIITLIMIPLAIFVIAPAIAQGAVTNSKLEIHGANLTDLKENSFVMTMEGKVTDTGPMAATITVPNGVVVSWNGTELGQLPLDTIKAEPFSGADLSSRQVFTITNKTAFGIFNKFMLSSSEFTWHMEGKANVKAAGLNLKNIVLSKDVVMGGMDNFPEVTINKFDAPGVHPDGGIRIRIASTLVNPSPIGVELGDLTFDIVYQGVKVGEVGATNFTLVAGDNQLDLNGRLIPQISAKGREAVGDLFSRFISGKNATTTAVATSVRPSDKSKKTVSWLQSAFNGTKMSVVLQGLNDTEMITGVTLEELDLVFSAKTPYSPTASSPSLQANFKMPFGFPLSMSQISQDLTILTSSGVRMAHLKTTYSPAKGDSKSGKIQSEFGATPFNVLPDAHGVFDEFSKVLTVDDSVSMQMQGTANAIAETPVGEVEIVDIPLAVTSSLKGLNGLKSKPVVINELKVTGGTSDHINIDLIVSMDNPSNVKITMGDVIFDLFYKGENMGNVIMEDFVLERGTNQAKVITHFGPQGGQAKGAARELLNGFMKGESATVNIQGTEGSTPIGSLKKALSSLQLTTSMPGLVSDRPVIISSSFSINLGTVFNRKGTASVVAFNPMDTQISFLNMKAEVSYEGKTIGNIDQDLSDNPIVIPAKQQIQSPDLQFNILMNAEAIKSLLSAIGGKLKTDIDSTIVVAIGDYQTTIDYAQKQVPTFLK